MKEEPDWALKVQQLQAAGLPLFTEHEEPLSSEERKILRGKRNEQLIAYAVMGIIIMGVPFLATDEELAQVWKITISLTVGVGFSVLLIKLQQKMAHAYKQPKKVIEGFITEKNAKKLEKSTHYYLIIGTHHQIHVDAAEFRRFNVGDLVEAQLFTAWGTVLLSLKKISKNYPTR